MKDPKSRLSRLYIVCLAVCLIGIVPGLAFFKTTMSLSKEESVNEDASDADRSSHFTVNGSEPADHVGSVTWQIDNVTTIGGQRATVLGSPTVIQESGRQAVAFDGTKDALLLDTNPLAGARSFTVEVIFRPDQGGAPQQRFLHMQESDENRVLLETRLNDAGEWFLDTFIKSGSSELTLQSREVLHPLGRWYHLALTYDGRVMRHYVDGHEELSGNVDYVPVNSGRTSIGCRLNQVYWFKGAIRSIRVTERALVPEQFSLS